MDIANRLRVLREANNLTQDDLAHKLGLSRSTISKYEIADRGPDIDTLINICEIYNITLEEFFKEEIECHEHQYHGNHRIAERRAPAPFGIPV